MWRTQSRAAPITSTRPDGSSRTAPNLGFASQNLRVPAGPITKKAVESASASVAVGAIADALRTWRAGHPVRGSRMWPYRRPPASKNWCVAADVPIA
jgi:hypothetical protein